MLEDKTKYDKYHKETHYWSNKVVSHSAIFRGTNKCIGLAKQMNESNDFRNNHMIYKTVYAEGEQNGYWDYIPKGYSALREELGLPNRGDFLRVYALP